MPTRILGISAFYHDSAAALVVDGEIIAAAQEERFTRIKHDAAFPRHAVDYCLREAGIAMQARMNMRVKFRESFRPFAPSVLAEDAGEWFDLDRESPSMLLTAPVRRDRWLPLTAAQRALMADPDLRQRVNVPRSTIPAVTHVDMSARVQTVDEARHGRYCRLLRAFKARTGCGVIVNSSFNIRGEPIVCTPQDAVRCFRACDMDVLVLEDCVLYKTEQPRLPESERQKYVDSFELD